MDDLIDVVKRGKRGSEPFDQDKLHASIVASCLSVRSPESVARHAADRVCTVIVTWAADKPEVTSADIRRQAARALTPIHPEAAYIYQHHNVIM
ncbi:MAG: hypothetical protein ABIP74_02295 [Candidatus Saccharimonas sp.]